MDLKFRNLRPDEVECRVAQINQKGLSLLLYKDARCDMNILDETVGALRWQRRHTRDNANCIVSIYNEDLSEWIEKEDTGTESNTEKEKGLASDSFKRACFNWGIGRELYTAPFIWISSDKCKIIEDKGKYKCFDKFTVKSMTVEDGRITSLEIVSKNNVVFSFGNTTKEEKSSTLSAEQKFKIKNLLSELGWTEDFFFKCFKGVSKWEQIEAGRFEQIISFLEGRIK